MNKTAAIILAAGAGTRMKSSTPKVLHEIAHKPMLGYVLGIAEELQLDPIVTVIAPNMDELADFVRPHPTAVQQKPLGTADAVKAAAGVLDGFDGDVLILYGDSPLIRARTLRSLMAARADADIAVLGFESEEPEAYGRLMIDENDELHDIVEASDADENQRAITTCNAGFLAISAQALFDLLEAIGNDNSKQEYYLTDIIGVARQRGLRCAPVMASESEVLGVNSRAELARAEAEMQTRLRRAAMDGGATFIDPGSVYLSHDTQIAPDVTIEPHVVFGPGAVVEENVTIRAFSYIEGASVSAGASVGPFARLRPGTVIGNNASIGNFVEIKQAQIGKGAKVNHLSYIGDAKIGQSVNIGAGTITCNYDGFDKHKTDIGAGAFVGSNTALVAPVKIGKGAIIGAGSVITRNVGENALGLSRAKQDERPGWAAKFRKKKG